MQAPFSTLGKRVVLGLGLALGMLCYLSPTLAADDEAKLRHLREQIKSIETSLKSSQQRHQGLENQIEQNDRKIAKLRKTLNRLKEEIQANNKEINQLKGQQKEIIALSQDHRQELTAQVRANYLMARNHPLKLLLSEDNPAKISRNLVYYRYINQRRSALLHKMDSELSHLKALQTQLQKTQSKQQTALEKSRERQQELKDENQRQTLLAAKLKKAIDKDEKRLNHLKADEQRLAKLSTEIYEAVKQDGFTTNIQFAALKGKLPWPVKGTIGNRYGSQRGVGKLRWQGIVIKASEGTQVRAVAPGTVVFSDWLLGYGFLVIVDHGNGYMSLYGYNRELLTNVGDKVNKSQVISHVGNSGGQRQSGLYFEIRKNGKTINPRRWISARR